ncbi:hypothetical protein OAV45_03705 [Candidatus Poseidoniales archaeon]|nr:hypothetical protein [Candidatus Poseidoniales archaeon]
MEGQESEALQKHQVFGSEVQTYPKQLYSPRFERRSEVYGVHRVITE